ncbi:type IV toxin-antitoxin system AbiEi family antitoxin domain-containing protein [Microbacterium timonense]|uniref:type IV toxin-antitoxin system AbiEi family antitoxin domain-containing protein n=1 Tax=Microbacterium timonense TaxID=2086576 RepID=UPI000D10BB88|nr:type IV toxin-antitoxin system AbiEi family antitoxin domain-containing protein [Microbacterium timonense]
MRTVYPGRDDVLRRADLIAAGIRPKQITRAVREGRLLRVRRDRYMLAASTNGIDRAVRVGGRLACVSLLVLLGVFVLDGSLLHVHVERTMSRLRSPDDPHQRLHRNSQKGVVLHWWPLSDSSASLGCVSLFDAVAQAVRCQPVRAAVATVDSVLHLGLMTWAELQSVFEVLPARCRAILRLADGTAESGPETFMRLILRQAGLRYQAQVKILGVGRVDFVVEDRLIVECDSRAHHEGWEKQRSDRRRDLAAANLGYATLRPLAEDVMYNPDMVRSALGGILRTLGRQA